MFFFYIWHFKKIKKYDFFTLNLIISYFSAFFIYFLQKLFKTVNISVVGRWRRGWHKNLNAIANCLFKDIINFDLLYTYPTRNTLILILWYVNVNKYMQHEMEESLKCEIRSYWPKNSYIFKIFLYIYNKL